MINSSIDSPNHRIYHTNKNIEKKFFFEFLPQKRGKHGENLCSFNSSHILKIRQKSSLDSILMINSSIDSPNHRIYHTNKNIEKKIFSNFCAKKGVKMVKISVKKGVKMVKISVTNFELKN